MKRSNAKLVIIVFYVNDLIVTQSEKYEIVHVNEVLEIGFILKDLGEVFLSHGDVCTVEMVHTPQGIWTL